MQIQIISILFFLVFYFNGTAYAYLGPGLGGGVIAATIGFLVALFAGIVGLLWFPIKKILKKKKKKNSDKSNF